MENSWKYAWAGEPVRLLATDIDGTMLRSDGSLSPRVRSALHAAGEAGIIVVPATGRPMAVAHDVIEALALGGTWVFANGAVTRDLDNDRLIRGFWMDRALARKLIADLRAARPRLRFAVEFEHSLIFEDPFNELATIGAELDAVADVAEALSECDEQVQKILVSEKELDIDELLSAVTTVAAGRASVTFSGLPFLEIAADEVTKATALSLLANDLAIPSSQVAAFGDNQNDVAMLEWAGRGFAMGNATSAAQAAANHVLATNDADGLALAIELLLEQR